MGAYAYCRHPGCCRGLDAPNLEEALVGWQLCADGHDNEIADREETLAGAARDLFNRVAALEERLNYAERARVANGDEFIRSLAP